jgi:predicted site-specific integrase-resolvase
MENKKLLTTKELAELIGVKPMTLYQWRHRGIGPAFLKFDHTVRYCLEDVNLWLQSKRRT